MGPTVVENGKLLLLQLLKSVEEHKRIAVFPLRQVVQSTNFDAFQLRVAQISQILQSFQLALLAFVPHFGVADEDGGLTSSSALRPPLEISLRLAQADLILCVVDSGRRCRFALSPLLEVIFCPFRRVPVMLVPVVLCLFLLYVLGDQAERALKMLLV